MNDISKTCLSIVLASLISLPFCGCENKPAQTNGAGLTNTELPKIGVMTILTGEASSYGEYTKQGLDLASAKVDATKFKMIFKNTKADPAEAVRVFRELEREGVSVIIGPFTSTEVRQVGPEAQRLGITLITSSATADDLAKIGDHIFMMLPPNSQQGADQANYALTELSAKSAAILYRQNPYGETLRKSFADTFEKGGGKIVSNLGFQDGHEEFRDRLKEILKSNPDVVFIPTHDADSGRILRQAQEVNIPKSVKFLGCDGSMSETMIELAGDASEGAIFSNVASVSESFDEAYEKKFGGEPNPYAAASYDTLLILNQLIESGARTSSDFQKALVGMKPYVGATGKTFFSKMDQSYWALTKPYSQFEVRNKKFELLESAVLVGSN